MSDLRYPIGKFEKKNQSLTPEERRGLIDEIASLPAQLRSALKGLSAQQLDTPYRPEGWSVRQLVHHVADSHIGGYVRFRTGLTGSHPKIQLYDQDSWAQLPDATAGDPELSLRLLDSLHSRWVALLQDLPADAFSRMVEHPEAGPLSLDTLLRLYAWHGRHHTAHITSLRQRNQW